MPMWHPTPDDQQHHESQLCVVCVALASIGRALVSPLALESRRFAAVSDVDSGGASTTQGAMEAAVGSITVCPLKRQLEDAKTWARAALKEVAAPNSHQVEAGVIVGPVGSAHHRSASDHDVLPLLVVAVMVRATMIVMRTETALRILTTIPATHSVRPSHSSHETRRPSMTTGMLAMNPTAAVPLALAVRGRAAAAAAIAAVATAAADGHCTDRQCAQVGRAMACAVIAR